ncbi:MAG: drug/metabolite exporter YedA [Actinobacteria bacterium RBG_16_68_21]|nr:MAG: drug/metabolite exporter YedA [Actinobacteria bacterium RBG_16_68_21]
MPDTSPIDHRRALIALSLVLVYVVWGSTYLALRYGLEGFPPFLMNGLRLLLAGGPLAFIARGRGRDWPTGREWASATIVGGILFIGGLGFVTIAEDNGVGSGLVASAVAVMPLWAALWSGVFGRWPNRLEWVGLVIGLTGVVMLSREGDFQATVVGTALMILSPILWAFGSVISSRMRLPKGLMASAAEMLGGGVLLLAFGWARGERMAAMPGAKAWLAVAYLSVFGSLFAYTAYAYLLANTAPAVATSYAYVNPVVAVVLGVTVGNEVVGGWTYAGLPIILAGVALVGLAQRRRRPVPI